MPTIIDRLSTGNSHFDKFLGGGYESDIITTFYGPGGSGKSNFCMCAVADCVRSGGRVIYIDTEGGFSTERFIQIFNGSKDKAEAALEGVLLLNPTTFDEQIRAFNKMETSIRKEDIDLIVVDSLVMLYRLELGDAMQSNEADEIRHINTELARQLRTLSEIARKQHIPVIVTNQVYSSFVRDNTVITDSRVSMVGGDLLKYWTKCLIELQQGGNRRKAILRKHRSLASGEFIFEIVEQGIRRKGLF